MIPGRGNEEGPGKAGAILDTFTRSVAQNGYDGTSFTMVATELGISRGLIAHHYGTKERLFAAGHVSHMRRRIDEARRIVSELATPAEHLAGLLYAAILYQIHDRHKTVAYQREAARLTKEDKDSEGRKLRAEYRSIVREVLDAGIASGEFRVVDTNVQSLLIFGAASWTWTWFQSDGRKTPEEIGAEFVDLVLGSLLVTRRRLARLADPDGPVVATVVAIISADDVVPG